MACHRVNQAPTRRQPATNAGNPATLSGPVSGRCQGSPGRGRSNPDTLSGQRSRVPVVVCTDCTCVAHIARLTGTLTRRARCPREDPGIAVAFRKRVNLSGRCREIEWSICARRVTGMLTVIADIEPPSPRGPSGPSGPIRWKLHLYPRGNGHFRGATLVARPKKVAQEVAHARRRAPGKAPPMGHLGSELTRCPHDCVGFRDRGRYQVRG